MTPVGKIVKLLLAMTVAAAIALGVQGCQKEKPAATPPAPAPTAAAPAAAPAAPATPSGPRVVEIKVTEAGYEPSPVTLKKGEPVTLKVTRTTDNTCATEVVLDEHNINTKLPLNETVAISFTPEKTGELRYGCAMGKMISGKFLIE